MVCCFDGTDLKVLSLIYTREHTGYVLMTLKSVEEVLRLSLLELICGAFAMKFSGNA